MLTHLLRWLHNRRQAALHHRIEQERRLAWEEDMGRRMAEEAKKQLAELDRSMLHRIHILEAYEESTRYTPTLH